MPIHDWTRVRPNRFHHFHQSWIVALADALNDGLLPPDYLALAEQNTKGPVPDVVALKIPDGRTLSAKDGGLAVATAPPQVRLRTESDAINYARRADRLAIRHVDGDLVAIVEIVSPGNKDSRHAVRSFTRKLARMLFNGIHVLMVDLFPPNPRNPEGLHKEVWDFIREEPYALPADKPLTLAAYAAAGNITAYVEEVAVMQVLPSMPLFLTHELYVPCPLETTYQVAWAKFPRQLKGELEG